MMMKLLSTATLATLVALSPGLEAPATASDDASARPTESINLIYSGVAVANTRPAPTVKAFTDWCNAATGSCFPTVQQPVYDMATGKPKGHVYVWGAFPFLSGAVFPGSICFSEYIVFALDQGDLHMHSGPRGTCGAFMDPVLKPPLYPELGATAVIAGGGDGVIVGGTRKYQHWTGTFTDRVFVGFGASTSGVGGIIYYDQLIFSIKGR